MNLNQVTLPVRDIPVSVAFYKRLGLIQIVDTPHYARFECPQGDATFSLHKASDASVGGAIVYFECDDLDSVCADLTTAGVDFVSAPRDERWLWREARLTDPDGHTICLYYAGDNRKNPPWRICSAP